MKPGDTVYFYAHGMLVKGTLRRQKKSGAWTVNTPDHENECSCGAVIFDVAPSCFENEKGEPS